MSTYTNIHILSERIMSDIEMYKGFTLTKPTKHTCHARHLAGVHKTIKGKSVPKVKKIIDEIADFEVLAEVHNKIVTDARQVHLVTISPVTEEEADADLDGLDLLEGIKPRRRRRFVSEKPAKKATIKSIAIDLIKSSLSDFDIVKQVKDLYPDSKFDKTHVTWYRSTLFKKGELGPEHAPRKSAAYRQWKNAR